MIFSLSRKRKTRLRIRCDVECLDLYTEPKWDEATHREREKKKNDNNNNSSNDDDRDGENDAV